MLLQHAAELGAIAALVHTGKLQPYLKKADAFRQFGRTNTERWIDKGWITPRKDGDFSAAWRLDRMEMEILSRAIALLRYL